MTEDQLRAIEARADAATPGPWYAIPNPDWGGAGWRIARDPNEPWANFGQLAYVAPQNGPFIAKAREDIPALVAEVRRLRELCAECIQGIEDWSVYASDYFKEKHGLDAEIEGYKARLGDTSEHRTEVERLRAQVDALAGIADALTMCDWYTNNTCADISVAEKRVKHLGLQLTAILNGAGNESEGI